MRILKGFIVLFTTLTALSLFLGGCTIENPEANALKSGFSGYNNPNQAFNNLNTQQTFKYTADSGSSSTTSEVIEKEVIDSPDVIEQEDTWQFEFFQ